MSLAQRLTPTRSPYQRNRCSWNVRLPGTKPSRRTISNMRRLTSSSASRLALWLSVSFPSPPLHL